MGSGKSTLGRRLSKLAGAGFIDLDREIEIREGMPVSDIFRSKGEDYFRQAEAEVLRSVVVHDKPVVVATGGGTPCFGGNMEFMNKTGVTVYIRMSPRALASRLEHDRGGRPLIEGLKGSELVSYIEDKLARREPFYCKSSIIIDGLGADPALLLEKITRCSDQSAD